MWINTLLVVAILVILFFAPRKEFMTNKDVMVAMKSFGTEDKSSKKSDHDSYAPIYGPPSGGTDDPKSTPSINKPSKTKPVGKYPDIFGPETSMVPGTKPNKKSGSHSNTKDDSTDEDSEPQFNPDFKKPFPKGPDEPQPFLTDFSKFLH